MIRTMLCTVALTLVFLFSACVVRLMQADAPTKGFLFRAYCSATAEERAERMIVFGNRATVILHDATLWLQAEPLIATQCELGMFEGDP